MEQALDELDYEYVNGFRGGLYRRFSPDEYGRVSGLVARGQLPTGQSRLAFLYKIHGSIGWWYDKDTGMIYESYLPTKDKSRNVRELVVYPSRAKLEVTKTKPFDDVFQAMLSALERDDTVLLTVGYSWSDDHINSRLRRVDKGTVIAFVPEVNPFLQGLMASGNLHVITGSQWLNKAFEKDLTEFPKRDFWKFEELTALLEDPEGYLSGPELVKTAPVLTVKVAEPAPFDPFSKAQSSYMMVLMQILFDHGGRKGRMPIDLVVAKFKKFYQDRLDWGLIAEKSSVQMSNPDRPEAEVLNILKTGPFKALREKYIFVDLDRREVGFVKVFGQGSEEQKKAVKSLTQKALTAYFQQLGSGPMLAAKAPTASNGPAL